MVDCCYLDTIHPPAPNPISTPRPVSCRLSNNVMEASMVGILSSTVGEQWEGCIEDGVYASVCVWRVDGLRAVIVKQKESSGAVTVPGRTRDNGELNGVLNGKSSVFSHRFNVIAALTLLRSAISFAAVFPSCVSLLLCFVVSKFPPISLQTQISHCPLFAGFLRLYTLDSFFFFPFSLPAILPLCPHHHGNCWPSGYFTYRGQFPPHVHNWPFGSEMSVHVPSHCLFLQNAQSISH